MHLWQCAIVLSPHPQKTFDNSAEIDPQLLCNLKHSSILLQLNSTGLYFALCAYGVSHVILIRVIIILYINVHDVYVAPKICRT